MQARYVLIIASFVVIAVLFSFNLLLRNRAFQVTPWRLPSVRIANTSTRFVPRLAKERCSFELYNKVASKEKDGNVVGRGHWTRGEKGSLVQFHPDICQLSYGMWIPTEKLNTCFKDRKIDHIVVLGDSNARYYMLALHRLLNGQRVKNNPCSNVYTHLNVTYKTYSLPTMLIKRRCRCGGFCTFTSKRPKNRFIRQAKCVLNEKMPLFIEYIPQMYWQSTDSDIVS